MNLNFVKKMTCVPICLICTVITYVLVNLASQCQGQTVTVTIVNPRTRCQPAPVCEQRSAKVVTVVTPSITWYQSATVVEHQCQPSRPVVVVQEPVYINEPVVVVEQPVPMPVPTQYFEPITVPVLLEQGPYYYGGSYGYYQSYPSYWGYPNVYSERSNIRETWRNYGFGHNRSSCAPQAPRYFPQVRQLPQPVAGVPFPRYNYNPNPMRGQSSVQVFRQPQQSQQFQPQQRSYSPQQPQQSRHSNGGGSRGGRR